MMKLLVYIALFRWAASACEYGEPVCEWKSTKIIWQCQEDHNRKLRAFWGRDAGDNETCVDDVPYKNLQNLNCPGDDKKAAEAVANWCDSNVNGDGHCTVHAKTRKLRVDGEKYDPCPGTFKYLRVCSSCTPGVKFFDIVEMVTDHPYKHAYGNPTSSEYLALVADLEDQMNNALGSSPGYVDTKVTQFDKTIFGQLYLSMRTKLAEGSGYKEVALAAKVVFGMSFTHSGKEIKRQGSVKIRVNGFPLFAFNKVCSVYKATGACLNGSSCTEVSGSPECTTE